MEAARVEVGDGTGNPSLKTMAAIAKALEVTISELVDGV